jgi:bifunctional non-homologous end joining protein LigD
MLWDQRYWPPEPGFERVDAALAKGELKFVMEGERLHGGWVLVRLRGDEKSKRNNWLRIKHHDAAAVAADGGALAGEDCSIASGRSMAQIARGEGERASPFMTTGPGEPDAIWLSRAAASAPTAAMPDFIPPQLCRSAATPPGGPQWAHEIKFDGYRMQLRTEAGEARLLTRTGLDWSDRFPAIVAAGAHLADGIIDGEVVALDHTGAPDFAALQAAISDGTTGELVYFAFDRMFANGEDLRPLPLAERKARLLQDLAEAPANIRYVDHFAAAGAAVLESACQMHLEGVVSKALDAPYNSGRTQTWVQSKCRQGHEVVIGGWTTTGEAFRSLIARVYRDGALVHVGRVGTGFGRRVVARLMPRLVPLETDESLSSGPGAPRSGPAIHWVRPELVAEIEYAGFTGDGAVRQAAFKGLREGKPADEVEAEEPASAGTALPKPARAVNPTVIPRGSGVVAGITISHGDKALWPDAGDERTVTKLDLAAYFEVITDHVMPHFAGRPCSIVRTPDGVAGERFFQRHPAQGLSNLFTQTVVSSDHKAYLQIDHIEAVIAAAQVAGVELHPWNCRPFAPEVPGRLVFDLDPAPDVAFTAVIVAAREVKARLEPLGLAAFCKTTGGKGLHVVTPIAARGIAWPQAKTFARDLCKAMASDTPDRFLVSMSKKDRTGRIFLDYMRNDRMATALAPFSPRGRPGAPVSFPLTLTQVEAGLDPLRYTVRTAPALARKTAAWKEYSKAEGSLADAIARLAGNPC